MEGVETVSGPLLHYESTLHKTQLKQKSYTTYYFQKIS